MLQQWVIALCVKCYRCPFTLVPSSDTCRRACPRHIQHNKLKEQISMKVIVFSCTNKGILAVSNLSGSLIQPLHSHVHNIWCGFLTSMTASSKPLNRGWIVPNYLNNSIMWLLLAGGQPLQFWSCGSYSLIPLLIPITDWTLSHSRCFMMFLRGPWKLGYIFSTVITLLDNWASIHKRD